MAGITLQEINTLLQIAALIVGCAALFLTFIGGFRGWRRFSIIGITLVSCGALLLSYYLGRTSKLTREDFYEYCCDTYGLAWDQYTRVIILEENGDAEISMNMTVRAITQDIEYLGRQYQSSSPPFELISTGPVAQLTNASNLIVRTDSTGYSKDLVFDPPLWKGSAARFLTAITWTAKSAFAMTAEEFNRKNLQKEVAGIRITKPTDTLTIVVVFPKDYEPTDIDFQVRQGEGGFSCEAEYIALMSDPPPLLSEKTKGRQREVTLAVAYPIIGLTYAITWKPEGLYTPSN